MAGGLAGGGGGGDEPDSCIGLIQLGRIQRRAHIARDALAPNSAKQSDFATKATI